MLLVDIILIIILAGFVFYGLFFGLIRTVGSLAGLLAGVWGAFILNDAVSGWATSLFFGFNSAGSIVTFILLFTIINRLTSFAFAMLDRTFDLISIIPFLKTINRLAGAIFGLIEGALVISLALYFLLSQPFLGGWLAKALAGSQVAPYFLAFLKTIQPALPVALEQIKRLLQK